MKWENFNCESKIDRNKEYLIVWVDSDGEMRGPIIGYWVEEERSFFSVKTLTSAQLYSCWPLRVDFYCEIEMPNLENILKDFQSYINKEIQNSIDNKEFIYFENESKDEK